MAADNLNADNNEQHVAAIASFLVERDQTLSLAESCTGGLISSQITAQSGVSKWYKGAVVSYAADLKIRFLSVPPTLIKAVGEVSLPVARAMAKGARENLQSDWALSVTGIAGPTGGSEEKPVGTVCVAVNGPGVDRVETRVFEGPGRQEIQRQTAQFALDLLLNEMR